MNQNQHIIPQVYLKQFGYKSKDGVWKVPTFNVEEIELMNKIDKTLVRQSNIKSLLAEINIYDLPIAEKDKKLLEDFFQLTENEYPKVIEELNKKEKISSKSRDSLVGFISLLFVRTNDYRLILEAVLDKKDYLYLEAIFDGNKERIKKLFSLPKKSAINFLIAFSGGYIYKCLKNFKISIIKSTAEEKWATTDNPVLVICKNYKDKQLDFMGIDTKVICPISPDYLAYIDHEKSHEKIYEGTNELIENRINIVDKITFEKIWYDLTDISRITKYLIVPTSNDNNNYR